MKCPICGNTKFVSLKEPLHDQYARLAGVTSCCTECGYILWTNPSFPAYYKKKMEEINQIDSQIQSLIMKRDNLENEKNNNDKRKLRIKEMKKELKIRQSLGDDDKRTRALIEGIQQETNIVKSGINPDIINQINNLEYRINELTREKEKIRNEI